ncbi:MAG: hypothetical protein KGI71_03850, partial [Patescibacteria group bacterium]|nr:hypothetical protein [Patescibacteria group bacterium]
MNGGLINSLLSINAFSSQNAIFTFNSVQYALASLGANSIYGVWNFSGNYLDSASNFLYPLANASLTINPAFALNSFSITNSLIDQGQTQLLSAQISGGTDPYSFNYLVYNSAGLVTNSLYTVSTGSGLGLDGSKDTGFIGTAGTSFTVSTLSTTNANDLVILYIYSSGCAAPTITDTAGLTWSKRFDNGANQFFSFYAYSPSQLSGDTITASYGACSVTQHDAIAFGISSPSPLTPFDSNINIPTHVTGTASTIGKSFVSTTHSYDFLLSMLFVNHAADLVTLPTGFTEISAGTSGNLLYLGYKVVSATQANAEYDWTLTSDSYQTIGDAAFGDISSNTFALTQSSSWGSGPFTYNLFVTDSATTPVTLSSLGNIYGSNTALGTPTIAPASAQANVVGDKVAFIATLPGGGIGTGPYTYNFILTNTITGAQIANQLYAGVSSTSNSFTYTFVSGDLGQTEHANVLITDSATTQESS